jgi:uncharacterized BrkB/YihY/UPF0761 family membrane protein
MPWSDNDRVVALRRRSQAVDVAVETLDGWRRHQTGRNASVLSFFSFLSIFPLLLVATTILGFVLQNNEDLQQRIVDGALADIPVIGSQLANDPASLNGSVWALVAGLATALWSATKAFVGLQHALDDVWEVDVDHRAGLPAARGKAIIGIIVIGAAQVATVVAAAIFQSVDMPAGGQAAIVVVSAAVNIGVVAVMYRYLTSAEPNWHAVWPGSIAAGLVITVLQQFGTRIVTGIVEGASDNYGQFALVLGLVTWLGFIAIAVLMSAELNAALVERGVNGQVELPTG